MSNAHRSLSTLDVLWLSSGVVLALIPNTQRFPLLLSLSFLVLVLWRIAGAARHMPLPDREHPWLSIAKQIVAVASFLAIYIAYHGQLGREAGVELLAALLGLKILEMRTERDYYVVTFLCYFLVVTNFFYWQTMETAISMLFVVVFVTAILVRFNTPEAHGWNLKSFKLAGEMTAQAMPVMLIAFVLFPRIPGPLWGLPDDAYSAVSGLSEDMSIGHINNLVLSDEIAFRVEFTGATPPASEMYWRGPVLWHTDGRRWRAGTIGGGVAGPIERLGESYRYSVMLEPHRKRFLFGLEMIDWTSADARLTSDMRLLAQRPVRRRHRYDLHSTTAYRSAGITAAERAAALSLPRGQHPRARELGERWSIESSSAQEVAERALRMFREEPFSYSLTPPTLPADPVDQFLFETREGFCEHFAASFVVLMRSARVPARVVTGYQGGEYNAVGDYLVVRQRDAHAWAEIYLTDAGWVRIDPTAAVSPERVSLGIGDVLSRRSALSALAGNPVASAFWTRIRDSWDAVTYGWNQMVLGYSPQRQRRMLDNLGFDDWDYGSLIVALTLVLAVGTLGLALLLLRPLRARPDRALRAYQRFCRKLERCGFRRRDHEPPLAFAARVVRSRRDLSTEVQAITRLYTQMRYGRVKLPPSLLEQRVSRFDPANSTT